MRYYSGYIPYILSPNVLFGVSLAQSYRESRNYIMASKIYKEVHALQPISCTVQLQLALGFIRANERVLAKNCLDYVAERMPDSIRYTHYMAIYEEKCNKDSGAALPCYKITTEKYNWMAEWQYIRCWKQAEPDWDSLPYLLELVVKYKNHYDYILQEINIQIGSYYLFEMHDILSLCQYLTKVIGIQPQQKQLMNHTLLFRNSEKVNIYHSLIEEIQFALQIGARNYDEDGIAVLKKALKLCHENYIDLLPPTKCSRVQASRSRLSRGNGRDNRGSSSHVKITNWREKRTSSTFRGLSRDWPQKSSSDGLNLSRRSHGSNNEKDYTTWKTDERVDQDHRNERHSLIGFRNLRNSTARANMGCRDFRQTVFSQPRMQSDSGEDASCCLVKNVKNLNL